VGAFLLIHDLGDAFDFLSSPLFVNSGPMKLHVFQLREAYILVILSLALGILGMGLLGSLLGDLVENGAIANLLMVIGEALLMLPAYLVLRMRHIALIRIMPRNRVHPLTVFAALALTAAMLVFIEELDRLLMPYFPLPDFLQAMEQDLRWDSHLEALLLAIGGVVFASIAEETLFRGVLQQSLLYTYRSHFAGIVITTAIFSIFHFQYLFYLPAALELILLALTLALVTDRTGNLFIAMGCHALFNLSAFLNVGNWEAEQAIEPLPLIWLVVGGLVLLASSLYLWRLPDRLREDVTMIEAPNFDEDDF